VCSSDLSCNGVEEADHHAYDFQNEVEKDYIGGFMDLKLGLEDGPDKKVYKVAGYQLAQAHHFKDFYGDYGNFFTPVFHGDGLLPDLWKLMLDDYNKKVGVTA